MPRGWYRYPTVHEGTVAFVAEDDLWSAPLSGGLARRLTTGLGACARPRFSPDGASIAFEGSEEGIREVYAIDREGGEVRRLSWLGDTVTVLGWSPGGEILFASPAGQPFFRNNLPYALPRGGGRPRALPFGPLMGLAFGSNGQVTICRNAADLAWWKGYRGGRMGMLWHRASEGQPFVKVPLDANIGSPLWRGDRLWFVADPVGTAQLCSARIIDGAISDFLVHTGAETQAVRYPASEGRWVVYTQGGELYRLDAEARGSSPERIEIDVRGQRTERQRRFPSPSQHLESWDLHPEGHSLVLTTRGQITALGNWEGPAQRVGASESPERYRLARWLDAKRIVAAHDAGEESIAILSLEGAERRRFEGLDHGWIVELEPSPDGRHVAFTDQRHGMYVLDTETGRLRLIDRSRVGPLAGFDWSCDGRWLAWAVPEGARGSRSKIRMLEVAREPEMEPVDVTSGEYNDVSPSFDPEGRYLYFLSYRTFDPVSDNLYFDYGFPRAVRPYLVTLHQDTPHPFQPGPKALKTPSPSKSDREDRPFVLEGILDRIVPFPVSEGNYEQIQGAVSGQVLLTKSLIRGTLSRNLYDASPPKSDNQLMLWEFDKQELIEINSKVSSLRMDRKREVAAIRSGSRLRVVAVKSDKTLREELSRTDGRTDRKSGFIDLARVRLSIDPGTEWAQMLREAWRRMRDHFWRSDLAGVDWDGVYTRYAPLVEHVSTRGELSDLIWCMQGELGTSHAYEMGGDYTQPPVWRIGRLGADISWDGDASRWRIDRIIRGEPGDSTRSSPLVGPGLDVHQGDYLLSINGAALGPNLTPEVALVNQSGTFVAVQVARAEELPRSFVVRTLSDERDLRYRDWVLRNRRATHEQSLGQLGYLHIPNMGPTGFAEFHRDFARESERDGLIVDVRYNGGGHVSQLLLGWLMRRRIGYKISRWNDPTPYPAYTIPGPMVAIANEAAGSDGDIFCHAWKRLELGPLVGTRTWGGVVGIWPREKLVDRATTTQPEYASWFDDTGFGLENYGTDPDVIVEQTPEDWAEDRDPQLERAIAIAREALEKQPLHRPPTR